MQTKRQKYEQSTVIRRAFRLGKVSDKGVFSPRIHSICTVKSAQAGLYLNLKKTKVISTEEIEEFEVDGEKVGVVRDFVFLGAKIEESGSCKGDILRRLTLGRAAMTGLNKI